MSIVSKSIFGKSVLRKIMQKNTYLLQLQKQLAELSELDELSFKKISNTLASANRQFGYDEKGALKVAFFDAKPYDTNIFEQQNKKNLVKLCCHTIALNEESAALAKGCKVVCLFVNDKCNKSIVEKLASYGVELIAMRCAGYNNVDLEACKKYGIDVVRVPAYSPHAVAEHAVALMLMLNRNLHRAYLRNRSGQFILDGLVGFNMHEKTVGVVGTGQIGQCVVNILLGFGCKVLAYDLYPNEALMSHDNFEYVDFEVLCKQSEIISLHAPLTPDTHHCINEKIISSFKDNCMIINTSRGGLIDTKALINALKSGKIGSAGLDVYEEEAEIFFHDMSGRVIDDDVFARLLSFPNVVVTSHQAFLTKEALTNIADTTLANIAEYQSGKRAGQLSCVV